MATSDVNKTTIEFESSKSEPTESGVINDQPQKSDQLEEVPISDQPANERIDILESQSDCEITSTLKVISTPTPLTPNDFDELPSCTSDVIFNNISVDDHKEEIITVKRKTLDQSCDNLESEIIIKSAKKPRTLLCAEVLSPYIELNPELTVIEE